MSHRTRLFFLFVTVPVVAFTLVGGFLGRAVAREDAYRHLRIFEDVVSLIVDNYVESTDLDVVMTGALQGLAGGLDTDSAYLSPDSVMRLESGAPEASGRVGVEVTSQYYTQIVAVRDGSPAARAGLRPGDYIRAIDDEPTRRLSGLDSANLLNGEPGSSVRVSLLRGNTTEPYDVELIREELEAPVVSSRIVETGVGYLRVAHFGAGVSDEIAQAVEQLKEQGATQLIVDVRSSAGGAFDEGISTARLFITSGPILQRTETGGSVTTVDATAGTDAITLPMLLLTDYGTAHAAELFAAAVTSAGRGDTVGQRTAGRVSLQKLVKLPDGGGLWLSWARYLDAAGEPIHRSGVSPTVAVDMPFVELGEPAPPDDPVLERALEHLQTVAGSEDRRVAQLVRAPA